MRRLLRLVLLWLLALALPVQGALAATGMRAPAPPQMTMADGATMAAADMPPCHHADDRSGVCGACCGPIVVQRLLLAVAPTALRWTALPRDVPDAAPTAFLTGGTDRPPRPFLD